MTIKIVIMILAVLAILEGLFATLAPKKVKGLVKYFIKKSDDYYRDKLDHIIKENKLNQHIIFTGFQENVANYINLMDIIIHSSILPEPFGRVILEAMSLKKPIIATNFGAPPEIIKNGETGFLVPPGDHIELYRTINRLLVQPDLSIKMGLQGYNLLLEKLTFFS